MTLSDKVLSAVATARTFWASFAGPCLWIGISAAVIGAGVSSYATFKVTRAFYQRATLKAKKDLLEWKGAADTERLAAKAREAQIMADAKGVHDEQMAAIAGVADDLRRLSAGVRVCTQVSAMRVSTAPVGPAVPVASGEPRPADVVLQELAAAFAKRADDNAANFNSLMERWEKLAKPVEK
jgi:hypothetical protein